MRTLNLSSNPDLALIVSQLRREEFLDLTDVQAQIESNGFITLNSLQNEFIPYTPTFTGFAVAPAAVARYKLIGNLVTLTVFIPNTASNGVGFTMTAPILSANIVGMVWGTCWWQAVDNSLAVAGTGKVQIPANSNVITLYTTTGGAGWIPANNKSASFTLIYETTGT
jgi:hypothetical protein